jgi:hypothetical protein
MTLVACGGFVYTTVGGTVTGLVTGSTLVLKNELNYTYSMTIDGSFSFRVPSDGNYVISVGAQPNPVNCTVTNGTGKMTSDAPVTNVRVNCVPNVPLSGTLTNLPDASSLVLMVNDVAVTALTANGAFTLSKYVVDGQPYVVGVASPPASEVCSVQNGTGTAHINDIPSASNLKVNCVPGVPVSGSLTGLKSGTYIILTNNGTDTRTLIGDGTYIFNFSLLDGASYDVQVTTQPVGQKCTVTNGSGKVSITTPANSANIQVTCVAG